MAEDVRRRRYEQYVTARGQRAWRRREIAQIYKENGTQHNSTRQQLKHFESRIRMGGDEARTELAKPAGMVAHLLSNDDGTFSIFRHCKCDHCDYCDIQGDCAGRTDAEPVPAVVDPYKKQYEAAANCWQADEGFELWRRQMYDDLSLEHEEEEKNK